MSLYGLNSGNTWSLGTITYSFSDPFGIGYYDRDDDGNIDNEYLQYFGSTPNISSLTSSQQALVNDFYETKTAIHYRVSIPDVVDIINFQDTTTSSIGDIVLFQGDLAVNDRGALAFLPGIEQGGDVWIDTNNNNSLLNEGQLGYFSFIHELTHAGVGLRDTFVEFDTNNDRVSIFGTNSDKDSQKYTIMSYMPAGWKWDNSISRIVADGDNALYYDSSNPLYAYGLQLYDIAEIQNMYGDTNLNTRSVDTIYFLGQGLGRDGDGTNAFLYTIWDGGGIDTIDASDFSTAGAMGAKIDLRQGEDYFSSIGENGIGGAAYDRAQNIEVQNVAIAYGTVIENAIGTDKNDDIFGNEVDNILIGRGGDDKLTGNEGTDTSDYEIYDTVKDPKVGIKVYLQNNILTVLDNWTDTDTLISIEKIIGSQFNDEFIVKDFAYQGDLELIGNGQTKDNPDVVDFSAIAGSGVTITFGSVTELPNISFSNIAKLKTGAGDDIVRISGNLGLIEGNHGDFIFADTGAGNDNVIVAGQGNEVNLGSGDDILADFGYKSIITTGDGADTIFIGNDTYITDASGEDKLSLFGIELKGAGRDIDADTAWATDKFGIKYSQNKEGDLVINDWFGRQTFVADYKSLVGGASENTAGIALYNFAQGAYTFFRSEPEEGLTPRISFEDWDEMYKDVWGISMLTGKDPLVLDMDRDGLIELSPESYVQPDWFDLTDNGFAQRTGWVTGDDALLARDLNSDGLINDITELFGNDIVDGFTDLATYDLNNDLVIDVNDAIWADLKIWQDNGDAITQAGELVDITTTDIQSIDLTPNTTIDSINAGNTITSSGTYTYDTGTGTATATIADVEFRNNPYDSKWLTDITVSSEAAALPQAKGHGTLPDLRDAMSYSTTLLNVVTATIPTMNMWDLGALRAAAMPILNEWANSIPVPAGTTPRSDFNILVSDSITDGATILDYAIQVTDINGTYWKLGSNNTVTDINSNPIDFPNLQEVKDSPVNSGNWSILTGDEISFMERWMGVELPFGVDMSTGTQALNAVKQLLSLMWGDINKLVLEIASQSGLQSYFDSVDYNIATDMFEPTTDRNFSPMLEAIFAAAPGTAQGDSDYLASWKQALGVILDNYDRGEVSEISYGYLFHNLVTAYENVGLQIDIVEAAGAMGIPEEIIYTGAGELEGSINSDIFYLDSTDQNIKGSNGPDNYIVGRNFGNDVITDIDNTLGTDAADHVRFAHAKSTDVTATRELNDLIITVDATGDTLRIVDQFDGRAPNLFGGFGEVAKGMTDIIFADGIVWDRVDMARAVSNPLATDDTIIGTDQFDYLDGGAGNDFLQGNDQGDIYIYGQNYGNDVIDEGTPRVDIKTPDIIHMMDLNKSDVSFSRPVGSDNLLITVNATNETLTVMDQFFAGDVPTQGLIYFKAMEGILFADNEVMLEDDIMDTVIADNTTTGDDIIEGFYRKDILDGGAGNDIMSGQEYDDTYYFGLGDGNDIIDESYSTSLYFTDAGNDTLIFKSGISSGDVTVSRIADSEDVTLTLSDNSSVTIVDQFVIWNSFIFNNFRYNAIENITFEDDPTTTWLVTDLQDILISQSSTAGDDTIYGFYQSDLLDGGTGNDRMEGGSGADTYIFNTGYGNDIIFDYNSEIGFAGDDIVDFGAAISINDVTFEVSAENAENLIVTLASGETLTVEKQFSSLSFYRIEEFKFNDGSITYQDLNRDLLSTTIIGTEGDDRWFDLPGGIGNDIIYGLGGNDWLNGLSGSSGDDLLYGEAGNDTLKGGSGKDYLDGGIGNDSMYGGDGDDTYFYSSGYDVISEFSDSGYDTLLMAESILSEDISIFRENSKDLAIYINDILSVVVEEHFNNSGQYTLDQVIFESDNSVIDLTNSYEGFNYYGTIGNDADSGTIFNDITYGLDGDDDLAGNNGDDIIYGDAGNDILDGDDGNDILIGGAGDDFMRGGAGDDIFVLGTSGYDIVNYNDFSNSGDADVLRFDASYSIDDLTFERIFSLGAKNLQITASNGYQVTVLDQYSTGDAVEFIQFGETGDLISFTDIIVTTIDDDLDNYFQGGSAVHSQDEILYGLDGNDNIQARAGDDIIYGGIGNDSQLEGEEGNDTIYGGDGDDKLYGDEKSTLLTAYSGEDSLYGGSGNDYSYGGLGDDKYFYESGLDTLVERGGGYDVVTTENFVISDITNIIDGTSDNVSVVFNVNTDEILFADQNYTNTDRQFEELVFADGFKIEGIEINATSYASWIYTDVLGGTISGSSTDDMIVGLGGSDIIYGGTGNDNIHGGSGIDEIYGGDGDDQLHGGTEDDTLYGDNDNDTIYGGDGNDTLEGGDGKDNIYGQSGDDLIRGGTGNDIIIAGIGIDTIYGDAGSDNIDAGSEDDLVYGGEGLDEIYGRAGNDTIKGQEGNDIIYGGAGDDVLYGDDWISGNSYAGDDTIYGGLGNDILAGDKGDDGLYGGEGNDILYGGEGKDIIDGGADYDTLSYSNQSNIGVTVNLKEGWADEDGDGVADDTILNIEKLKGSKYSDLLIGSDNDDYITGYEGDDTIYGGLGNDVIVGGNSVYSDSFASNDYLYGEAGNDSIRGSHGDDFLYGGDDGDVLYGGWGNDLLDGGAGNDLINFGDHTNRVDINLEAGIVEKTPDDNTDSNQDTLISIEYVRGSSYNDIITGSENVGNKLYGDIGDDIINGLSGNDKLYGEGGADTITGGTGADTFYWLAADLDGSIDTITDFSTTEGDTLDISNILDFTTGDAITEYVQITDNGTDSILAVDTDGLTNGQNFVSIAILQGSTGLTDEDLLVTNGSLVA